MHIVRFNLILILKIDIYFYFLFYAYINLFILNKNFKILIIKTNKNECLKLEKKFLRIAHINLKKYSN